MRRTGDKTRNGHLTISIVKCVEIDHKLDCKSFLLLVGLEPAFVICIMMAGRVMGISSRLFYETRVRSEKGKLARLDTSGARNRRRILAPFGIDGGRHDITTEFMNTTFRPTFTRLSNELSVMKTGHFLL